MRQTAKQLKSKAPFYWQAVEDGVYNDCKSMLAESRKTVKVRLGYELTEAGCRRIAHNAAFIATSEFVSRAKR